MSIHHLFLPHKQTHKKAKLISWQALLIYALLFINLEGAFSVVSYLKPGILGTTSNISASRIIELTNQERAKSGLSPLAENSQLSQAAAAKASNMFEENYWAHFSPSGKDPWGFILGAGYRFTVAGENLAKNFTNSEDVVVAWMNSTSHKENIMNPKYKDIGIAVEDGDLQGQRTTLVVQEFGATEAPVAGVVALAPQVAPTTQPTSVPTAAPSVSPTEEPTPSPEPIIYISGQQLKVPPEDFNNQENLSLVASVKPPAVSGKPLFDPFVVTKVVGISLAGLIAFLLMLDFMVLRSRGVFRFSSHHLANLSLILVLILGLLIVARGSIL
jgi:hypothetical protein